MPRSVVRHEIAQKSRTSAELMHLSARLHSSALFSDELRFGTQVEPWQVHIGGGQHPAQFQHNVCRLFRLKWKCH